MWTRFSAASSSPWEASGASSSKGIACSGLIWLNSVATQPSALSRHSSALAVDERWAEVSSGDGGRHATDISRSAPPFSASSSSSSSLGCT